MEPDEGQCKIARIGSMLRAVPRGMGLPQLQALLAVAAEPGLSVNDLADRIGAPQQSASRYASVLLGRYQDVVSDAPALPLVEQRISEDDPRRRALFLSPEGRGLVDQIVSALWPSQN